MSKCNLACFKWPYTLACNMTQSECHPFRSFLWDLGVKGKQIYQFSRVVWKILPTAARKVLRLKGCMRDSGQTEPNSRWHWRCIENVSSSWWCLYLLTCCSLPNELSQLNLDQYTNINAQRRISPISILFWTLADSVAATHCIQYCIYSMEYSQLYHMRF